MKILKVQVGDTERNAIEVDFEIGKEDWNVYCLLDGDGFV